MGLWLYSRSMASVLISLEAGVLSVTLNRPEKLNAFVPEMHEELRRALEQALEDRSIRAVLLTGAGRAFCAGQDLSLRNVAPGAADDPGGRLSGRRRGRAPVHHRQQGLGRDLVQHPGDHERAARALGRS